MQLDDIKTMKRDMTGHYSVFHTEYRKDERYYDLAFLDALNLPRKFAQDGTVLPTAREVVDTAVDHVAPGFRRVTVPRRSATASATDQARKIQRFCEALLTYFERIATTNPYRDCSKHLGMGGLGSYKILYDERKWPKEPDRSKFSSDEDYKEAHDEWKFYRAEQMPFTLEVIHPTHILFDPFSDAPQWVIEVSRKYACQVKEDYPSWPNSHNVPDYKEVEVIEWWSNTHRAVMVNEESALRGGIVKHKWRTHPYIIGSSGYGYIDADNKPEKRYVGFLRYIRGLLEAESRNYSIADIVIKAGAWPIRVAKGDRANEMPTINLEYGQVHPMPPGVEMETLTPDLPEKVIFDFMSVTEGIISGATAPRVVRGLHSPGISSGFDRQLALGEARLRYGSLADAQKKMLTEICKKALIIGEALVDGPISLTSGATEQEFMAINLKTEVRGHYAVNVEINVMEPEDEIRKQASGMSMVTGGTMSPQEFIRKYRPDVDPDTEMGKILAARLIFGAQMMQLLGGGIVQKVASNMALEEFIMQMLNPEAAVDDGPSRRTPANPQEGGAEPDVDGSRQDQARMRGLDMRELGI